jgi:hypothetical protein
VDRVNLEVVRPAGLVTTVAVVMLTVPGHVLPVGMGPVVRISVACVWLGV